MNKMILAFSIFRSTVFIFSCTLFFAVTVSADDFSFTNLLAQAKLAEKRDDLPAALNIYEHAEKFESSNAAGLCVLTRDYCDLMYLTDSTAVQKKLVEHALTCALQAVTVDPKSALAHASLAVCYAKACAFADIKTEVAYSRLFKTEAEAAIALDPKQDIAYHLLGRWYYAVANMNIFSKGFVKIVYGGLPPASNEEAIKNFKIAISIAPGRIIHHAELAKVYETTGQKKLARQELEKCRALKPLDRDDADAQQEAIKSLNN